MDQWRRTLTVSFWPGRSVACLLMPFQLTRSETETPKTWAIRESVSPLRTLYDTWRELPDEAERLPDDGRALALITSFWPARSVSPGPMPFMRARVATSMRFLFAMRQSESPLRTTCTPG